MSRYILIRFDDICPTMNWKEWKRALQVLDHYNIRPLLGVIPDCQDPELMIDAPRTDFWEYIKELQNKGYAIAMHGYTHKYDTTTHGIVNNTPHSEFAGHSYETQYEKIHKGKEILSTHGIFTDIFFAPAHSYDENTLRALAANGFKYVSDGKSSKPFMRHGVLCIPCRSSGCPEVKRSGYYTAVFHAQEWMRPDKAYGYNQLKQICELYSDEIVTFSDYAKCKAGKPLFQSIDEHLYLIYEYKIKVFLRPTVHLAKITFQKLKRYN